jgi:hypothetical protein
MFFRPKVKSNGVVEKSSINFKSNNNFPLKLTFD